jgi:hypothetical protein
MIFIFPAVKAEKYFTLLQSENGARESAVFLGGG